MPSALTAGVHARGAAGADPVVDVGAIDLVAVAAQQREQVARAVGGARWAAAERPPELDDAAGLGQPEARAGVAAHRRHDRARAAGGAAVDVGVVVDPDQTRRGAGAARQRRVEAVDVAGRVGQVEHVEGDDRAAAADRAHLHEVVGRALGVAPRRLRGVIGLVPDAPLGHAQRAQPAHQPADLAAVGRRPGQRAPARPQVVGRDVHEHGDAAPARTADVVLGGAQLHRMARGVPGDEVAGMGDGGPLEERLVEHEGVLVADADLLGGGGGGGGRGGDGGQEDEGGADHAADAPPPARARLSSARQSPCQDAGNSRSAQAASRTGRR